MRSSRDPLRFIGLLAILASCKSSTTAPAPAPTEPGHADGHVEDTTVKAPKPLAFTGTFVAEPGAMFIPREGDVPNAIEWAGTKFRGDDAGVGRGTGTLSLHVDDAGLVQGEGAGTLGPFTVAGRKSDGRIVATFRGLGPDALFGTLYVAIAGSDATGEGRASDGEARIVRSLKVSLKAD